VIRSPLDPLERSSEILFGLIMVLTFTSSISVAEAGRAEVRTILEGAIACNLAWGLVDAAMYLMSSVIERARTLKIYRAVREAAQPATAHRLIRDALPRLVSEISTDDEIESIWRRIQRHGEPPDTVRLTGADFAGAVSVFLLVFLSTLPVAVPFIFMHDARVALRASNAVAIVMLFAAGWSLARYAGRSAWRGGLETVAGGVALVAITIALGG